MPDWVFPAAADGSTKVESGPASSHPYVMEAQEGGSWCWAAVTAAVASNVRNQVVTQHEVAWAYFKQDATAPAPEWCKADKSDAQCAETVDVARALGHFSLLRDDPVAYTQTLPGPFVLRVCEVGDHRRGHVVLVVKIEADRVEVLDPMGPETADGHTLSVVFSPPSRFTVGTNVTPCAIFPVKS